MSIAQLLRAAARSKTARCWWQSSKHLRETPLLKIPNTSHTLPSCFTGATTLHGRVHCFICQWTCPASSHALPQRASACKRHSGIRGESRIDVALEDLGAGVLVNDSTSGHRSDQESLRSPCSTTERLQCTMSSCQLTQCCSLLGQERRYVLGERATSVNTTCPSPYGVLLCRSRGVVHDLTVATGIDRVIVHELLLARRQQVVGGKEPYNCRTVCPHGVSLCRAESLSMSSPLQPESTVSQFTSCCSLEGSNFALSATGFNVGHGFSGTNMFSQARGPMTLFHSICTRNMQENPFHGHSYPQNTNAPSCHCFHIGNTKIWPARVHHLRTQTKHKPPSRGQGAAKTEKQDIVTLTYHHGATN